VLHVQPYFTANRERTMADLTIDDLTEMMVLLDKDGNQDVCKEEFKEYCESTMGISSDAFEKMWNMIDCNGDGNLQFSELCEYFGVSVSDAEAGAKAKKQMSDEDILVMLELGRVANGGDDIELGVLCEHRSQTFASDRMGVQYNDAMTRLRRRRIVRQGVGGRD
jgi:hypothetical protein